MSEFLENVLGFVVLAAIVAAVFGGDSVPCVGEGYTHEFTLETKSLGGKSRMWNVKAELIHNGESRPIEVSAVQSDEWDGEVKVSRLTFKGVPLTGLEATVDGKIRVQIPNDAELVGKKMQLRIRGQMLIPKLVPGSKESFFELTRSFQHLAEINISE